MEKLIPNHAWTFPVMLEHQSDVVETGRRFTERKRFRRIVVLASALLLISSMGFTQMGTVSGRVTGVESGLHAATVALGKTTVLTDDQGRFSISVDPGIYTLVITQSGYKEVRHSVTVASGKETIVEVRLVTEADLDEVVVLGSRSLVQRSNLNTAVPVDVFSANQLKQTAQMSLTHMLNYSAPSFNASRPHNNEPATLRGLNPDHLLLLVNGTRRHSMAIITASGARGQLGGGSAPNDLNSIPFTAIEKVEILRDGAAAQYGSDAIAGVINIQLKKSTGSATVHAQAGQFYTGDGEHILLGVNKGFSLNKKGFLNFSADFRFNNSTYRGGTYLGTVYKTIPATASGATVEKLKAEDDSLIRVHNFNRNKVSNAGSPKINRLGALLNGGYPVGKRTELFWTAAVNSRASISLQGYQFPKTANRINPDLFPHGFQSRNNHRALDISGIAGARGKTAKGWRWEGTSAYGNNNDRYQLDNGNNATQFYTHGKTAPTSFYFGTLIYGQLSNSLQFSKSLSAHPGKSTNVSVGAEWRFEHYTIKPGETSAWTNYDSLARKQVAFGGWAPENAISKNRSVGALYVDYETEFTRRFLIAVATRYENYNDFGGNLAGKVAARYKVTEGVSFRGSVNNGFRAPSLPQRYYTVLNKNLVNVRGVLTPSIRALFRNDSREARAFGIPNLTAERSLNFSGGVTAALGKAIRMTVDAYWIQIRNRIVLSGAFDTTNGLVKEMLRPFPGVTSAQFFVNAIHTRTKGVDAVISGKWRIEKANLSATLAGNFTQTRLFGAVKSAGKLVANEANSNILFNREERGRLEYGQPDSKVLLSLNYTTNRFGLVLRNTRFGKTRTRFLVPSLNPDEHFSSRILTDFSVSFLPKAWLTLTAGANNIFDVYPDRLKDPRNTQEGVNIYSLEASPFGFYGGYYFVSMGIQLDRDARGLAR